MLAGDLIDRLRGLVNPDDACRRLPARAARRIPRRRPWAHLADVCTAPMLIFLEGDLGAARPRWRVDSCVVWATAAP